MVGRRVRRRAWPGPPSSPAMGIAAWAAACSSAAPWRWSPRWPPRPAATSPSRTTSPSGAMVPGARRWARSIAAGALAALVPWELVCRGRRPVHELVFWSTAAFIAVAAVGRAVGRQQAGTDFVDVATWLVAASATVATVCVVTRWWRSGRWHAEDPLLGWLAFGAVDRVAGARAGAVRHRRVAVPGRRRRRPAADAGDAAAADGRRADPGAARTAGSVPRAGARRHRLDRLLPAAIIVVYTGVVAGLGRLVGGSGPTWLLVGTTAIIAVVVDPVRHRVRWLVDRLVWGTRDDPLAVVRGVVDHLGADSGDELLPALAISLQHELRLDAVAIDVRTADGWQRAAAIGSADHPPADGGTGATRRGRSAGSWSVGSTARSCGHATSGCSPQLVGPLGLAVGWVRLATTCGARAVAVVSAREEERRRLRRDLHDGLGPALTGVSLGLRTAVRQLDRSPDAARRWPRRGELLDRVADEVDCPDRRAQADRARPATDGARPARARRRRRRVHPGVRRRPRDPPDHAAPADRAPGGRRGGDVPHRHRGGDQRRAPRAGGAVLADDRHRADRRHRRGRRRHRDRRPRRRSVSAGRRCTSGPTSSADPSGSPRAPHGTHVHVCLPTALP